jgi:hypothetical protein
MVNGELVLKKPYCKPQFIIHGSVEDLTREIGGGSGDGESGSIDD